MSRSGMVVMAAALWLVNPAQADDPRTVMTQRGKEVLRDDLTSSINPGWKKAKGRWEIKDGYLEAAELKADMHGAVMRYSMPLNNAIFQYDFRFNGATRSTLSLNASKGHLSRVLLSPNSLVVKKDSLDHNKTDKAEQLDVRTIDLKPGSWHTLVVEVYGKEIVASVDGKTVGYGKHDGIDRPKGNFGLTVAGEKMSFKNLRVWEAQPHPAWETTRQELLDTRSKQQ